MKVASVTVLYNFDKSNIENIKTYEKYVDEVIVVDNSDTDENYNELKNELKNYIYIKMNGNEGIAKALNFGIEKAKELKCDWVLTMDQDTKVNFNIVKGYIDVLNYKIENKKNVLLLSPNYNFDRHKCVVEDKIEKTDYVMQSANLVNIYIFESNGKFKEDFFIDMVDFEFCLRAKRNAYDMYSCKNLVVSHNPGITKTTKLLKKKYGYCSPLRIYYQSRNILWTFKEYKNIKIFLILLYKLYKIIFLFDNKKEFLNMYFKGIKDCKNNKFGKYVA